jgi:hypothetical protein
MNSNSNIDYKNKALKYKIKYLELKKQFAKLNIEGGMIPDWYVQFKNELSNIYSLVNSRYGDVVLTGSASITYLLGELGMDDELNNFKPNDLDFFYKSKYWKPNPETIGNYKIKSGQEAESSITYNLISGDNFIKSFDISKVSDVKSFNLNGIEIINLNRLKSDYTPDFTTAEERIEKDKYKIALIDKIIKKISSNGEFHKYGLGDNITTRPKRNSSSMFGDDSDNESDNDFNPNPNFNHNSNPNSNPNSNKRKSSLFGFDSDDE